MRVQPTVIGLIVAISVARALPALAQPRFKAGVSAVVVDVVVRDKGHRPITGLSAADFEVFEDGRRQVITSVDEVAAHDVAVSPGAPVAALASPASAGTPPSVVALVFDQLSASGRFTASKAAREFVAPSRARASFVGVFAVDRALHALVPYTRDLDAVSRGIDTLSVRAGFGMERAGQVPGAEYQSADAGQRSKATQDDSPYFRGHATLAALEDLVTALAPLPGRKAVAFFSEGLALGAPKEQQRPTAEWHDTDTWLSDTRFDRFRRLVELASRAQVSFYTFDAAGLRIDSPLIDPGFGEPPYVGLQFLADETGGAFFENSNDLVPGVQRLQSDLGHYYLVGYESTRPPDDKYRELRVKVRRDGVSVLARRGYLATTRVETDRLQSHEVAPLLALQDEKIPNQFPLTARAFALQSATGQDQLLIVGTVPPESITRSDTDAASAAITVLARVKDAKGAAIRYASDRFTIEHPAQQAHSLVFWKTTALPGGLYTVEVAAYHEDRQQASVRLLTAGMPPAGRKSHLGDVVLARAVTAAGAGQVPPTAMPLGAWWVQPDLDATVRAGDEVPFVFCALAGPGTMATVTIVKDGRDLASVGVPLPARGPDGRSVYVGRVPTSGYGAGVYQLKVTLEHAGARESRSATFRIKSRESE